VEGNRDVPAAVDFVHQVDPMSRVAIIGRPLGGVAALVRTPPLKVDALVLEEVHSTIENCQAQPDGKLSRAVRPNGDTSPANSVAVASWRFIMAIVSRRPHQ